ncbi:uncharacterized protein LOC120345645 isoform X1 [Styela clava]
MYKTGVIIGIIFFIIRGSTSNFLERSKRKRRSTEYCTYTYESVCEKQVHDPNLCIATGFTNCYSIVKTNCTKTYQACCNDDVMDNGICYGKDEDCDDCYTINDCDGNIRLLQSRYGIVSSKNYPNVYPPNQDCAWVIKGPRNSTIEIEMLDFHFEDRQQSTDDCDWDWVKRDWICKEGCVDYLIIEGSIPGSVLVEECGKKSGWQKFNTDGSIVRIRLHSDDSVQYSGFQLLYTIIGGEDPIRRVAPSTPPMTRSDKVTLRPTTMPSPSSRMATSGRPVNRPRPSVPSTTRRVDRTGRPTTTPVTTAARPTNWPLVTTPRTQTRPSAAQSTPPPPPSPPSRPQTTKQPITTRRTVTAPQRVLPVVSLLPPVEITTKPPVCPGRLKWSNCPKCTRTCSNYQQSEEDCIVNFSRQTPSAAFGRCIPGCQCPSDYPIWHKLKCVKVGTCLDAARIKEVLDVCKPLGLVQGQCLRTCKNIQASIEDCVRQTRMSMNPINGFVCVCPNGQFMNAGRCVTSQACQRELSQKCAGDKVWFSCKPKCEQTCRPGVNCRNLASACESGCACPRIRPVFHQGACVTKRACPGNKITHNTDITCGKQHYQPMLRIVGGETAVKGSWPWMVQIEKIANGKYSLTCGGTLICDRWVLTASHCFLAPGKGWVELDVRKYRLHIGKHHKDYNLLDLATGMLANIVPQRIIPHEDYDVTSQMNDIALIQLPNRIPLNKLIRPACVFNQSFDFYPSFVNGESCISAGWGAETNIDIKTTTTIIRVLKQVKLYARRHSLCRDLFRHFDINKMHCVGGQKNVDTCPGDSGGPLMCKRGDRWYVDGIVSFGLQCGVQDEPGVYTRVAYYNSWIHKYTGTQCGSPEFVWKRN